MMNRAQVLEERKKLVRPEPTYPDMTHRQILTVLSGLIMAMFVSALGSTIVTNALPRLAHELKASEAAYTWVVTATLLTMTASTPIWGKMADRFDRKKLMQGAILYYILSCWFAGLCQNIEMLILARALQGIGSGGVMAVSQVIIGAMIPPRQRGKYAGYLGASFALATVAGPLIGGAIVDTPFLGWRGIFYASTPLAIAALFILHFTLHLPAREARRRIPIDFLGGTMIIGSVCTLLIYVSLAGAHTFAWVSPQSAVLVPLAVLLLIGAILAEQRALDPIIPLELFKNRTVLLVVSSGALLGVSMIGTNVFLGQYFQIGQGHSAIVAGMLTLPLVSAMFLTSLVSGRMITRTGKWKRYLLGGVTSLIIGLALLSRLSVSTPALMTGVAMALVGVGIGSTNQNLVLIVQNSLPLSQLGVGSSAVQFFRTLGSATGLSILGSIMTLHVTNSLTRGYADAGVAPPNGAAAGSIPDVNKLPREAADIVSSSYADTVALIFTIMLPLVLLALFLLWRIKEVPLRQRGPSEADRPKSGTESPAGTPAPEAGDIGTDAALESPVPATAPAIR
ncbi:MAG: transporter [Pseudonocardiales bacterium]|nr:transporter [Pseudonocardiales bacterium]